jgi:hypothetical protein
MYWFTAGDHLPAGNHDDQVDEGGQQHQPQRDAVHAQVVVTLKRPIQGSLLDELHGSGAEFEAGVQRQRDQERPVRRSAPPSARRPACSSRPRASRTTPKAIGIQIARLSNPIFLLLLAPDEIRHQHKHAQIIDSA